MSDIVKEATPTQSLDYDAEKGQGEKPVRNGNTVVMAGMDASSPDGTVHRQLEARHLQMVSDVRLTL